MSSRRLLLNEAARRLDAAGIPDARLDAQWMLAAVEALPRLTLLTDPDMRVTDEREREFVSLVSRRALGEPLQYVLGEAHFMGHAFYVDPRVLIPRPDTEALCEAAIDRIQDGMRVLDIGTGSGALAISIALACPGAHVTAIDISADALCVAMENGGRLGAKVRWLEGDLFPSPDGRMFDIIVSNPPYIASGELSVLQREVRREPTLALDGGGDGLSYYRRILTGLPVYLKKGGSLLLEIGDGQNKAVSALMAGHFAAHHMMRDLAGLPRVLAGDGYAG